MSACSCSRRTSRVLLASLFVIYYYVYFYQLQIELSLLNIMSVLTMNEKLMCCASIYFQMEVKVFVEVCGVLEVV